MSDVAEVIRVRVDWCTCAYEGKVNLKPKVINQRDFSLDGCCAHCAFASSLRMANLVKWFKTNLVLFNANEEKLVDIRHLITTFKPPKNITILMSLVLEQLEGRVKAEGTEDKLFQFSGYKPVGMGSLDDEDSDEFEKRFLVIEKHLEGNGAAVGCVYLREDFEPHKNKVYVGDKPYIEKEDNKRMRHAVCIMGTAEVLYKGRTHKAFLYLESEQPKKLTKDGSGFGFMLAKAMHRVYLLEA